MRNRATSRIVMAVGARTPFAKAGATLKDFSALELATHSVNGALENQHVEQI